MIVEIQPNAYRRMLRSIRLVYGEASLEVRERLVERILTAARSLALHPGAGQFEKDLDHLGMGHRRLVVGKFKVIYRVKGERVIISDIFDARQDPKKMRG